MVKYKLISVHKKLETDGGGRGGGEHYKISQRSMVKILTKISVQKLGTGEGWDICKPAHHRTKC